MPPASLQKIMGHQSLDVTMTHYVHLQQRDLVEAVQRVDLGLPSPMATETAPS